MKPRGVFDLTEFDNRSGSSSWRVTGTKATGERVRTNFSTKAEATAEKQRLEIEAANLPPSAGLQRTALTKEQIAEAERAFADLAGKPLLPAVRYYLHNYKEAVTKKPLVDAFNEFLASKTAANKRPHTIRNLRVRVGRLVTRHADKHVSDITSKDVGGSVHRVTLSPKTRDNERRALSSFFAWATKQGYSAANPVDSVEPIKAERDSPEILSLAAVRRILEHARSFKDGALLPYFAIGIFAAVRPAELARLTWDDIDLSSKNITIEGKAAKLRQRRTVALSDNLVAWLLPFATRKIPLAGTNWRRDFDAVKTLCGYGTPTKERPNLKPWTQDVMRHTGVSYHYAEHQHEGQTASWAGNSPDIIHRHYKGLVKAKDAKEFWNIMPDSRKIIGMKVA